MRPELITIHEADAETLGLFRESAADKYAWELLGHAIAYQQGEGAGLSLVDAAFAVEKAQRAIWRAILARPANRVFAE